VQISIKQVIKLIWQHAPCKNKQKTAARLFLSLLVSMLLRSWAIIGVNGGKAEYNPMLPSEWLSQSKLHLWLGMDTCDSARESSDTLLA